MDIQFPGFGALTQHLDDMPSLSLMIAGLAAPTQLNWLNGENNTRLAINTILLTMDIVAIGSGWNMKCVTWIFGHRGSYMRPWLAVDALSLAFTVIVRFLAMRSIYKTYAEMATFEEEPLVLPPEPAVAFRMQLERSLLVGAQAMLQYDKLANSAAFKLLDVLPAFDFVWQLGGVFLLFDTPGEFCQAGLLMNWARVRGIVFLIGFLPAVLSLGIVGFKSAVASSGFCMAVLKGAHEADKSLFPTGPPVVTLLVRAFLVRDSTDMQAMELQVIDFEKQIALGERDRLKMEYEAATVAAQDTETRYAEQKELVQKSSQDEEFLQQYRQTVGRLVHGADLVATDAAGQQTAAMGLEANFATTATDLQAGFAANAPGMQAAFAANAAGLQAGFAASLADPGAAALDRQAAAADLQTSLGVDGDGGTGSLGSQLAGALDAAGLPSSVEGAADAGRAALSGAEAATAQAGLSGLSSTLASSGVPNAGTEASLPGSSEGAVTSSGSGSPPAS